MRTISYLLAILLFTSCSGSKSTSEVRTDITALKTLHTSLIYKIDSINQKRIAKFNAGEIDPTTDSLTEIYLRQLKDSLALRLAYFNALVSNKKIRKDKKNVIVYLNEVKDKYPSELQNVYLLDDLFGASTFNRLNTAAFFGPGQYELSDSTAASAEAVMQTISKEALNFSIKHSGSKLKAMFIVLGYADEQDISIGSGLYNDLIKSFPDSTATRKQLNSELSNRRAHSIKSILKAQYDSLVPALKNSTLTEDFISIGKGEQLPPGNKTAYQPIDDNRRVVLVYWNILPDLEMK